MALGDMLKGWAFVKLLKTGFGFIAGGLIILAFGMYEGEVIGVFCSIPAILIGSGLLYWGYGLWKEEKEKESVRSSESTVSIGYSKETEMKECPRCGKEEMEVAIDGSGICENCSYVTEEYSEEIDTS